MRISSLDMLDLQDKMIIFIHILNHRILITAKED